MSWTVILLKLHGGVQPIGQFEEGDVRPLGTRTEIRGLLSGALPSITWTSDDFGRLDGDGFGMELTIHKGDPATVVGVRAVGGGNALGTLVNLVTALDWVAYDASSGDFIDPANPFASGFPAYQSYRDRVVVRSTLEQ